MSLVNWREPDSPPKAAARRDDLQQRASIAQVLLVARLRARNRRDLAVDSLENAARVILVTCKNWFSSGPVTAMSDAVSDDPFIDNQPVRAMPERQAPDDYQPLAAHEETNAYRHH